MAKPKVLMTGAAGYIASQMLPTFRERYDLVLVDVTQKNRRSEDIKDVWEKTIARASNFHV